MLHGQGQYKTINLQTEIKTLRKTNEWAMGVLAGPTTKNNKVAVALYFTRRKMYLKTKN